MRDTFYVMTHLSLKEKEQLLREAKELSAKLFIDEKDERYRRVPSSLSFEEMIQKMNSKCHYVFIERRVLLSNETPYLEIGFCTMGESFPGDWFLFMHLDRSHLWHFIDKYKLTPM